MIPLIKEYGYSDQWQQAGVNVNISTFELQQSKMMGCYLNSAYFWPLLYR
jgi:hypothetical protein